MPSSPNPADDRWRSSHGHPPIHAKTHPGTFDVLEVLHELAAIVPGFDEKFVVIGGMVPWLRYDNPGMPAIGSRDLDLGVNVDALAPGEFAAIVDMLVGRGYRAREFEQRFQLLRPREGAEDAPAIEIDFLLDRPHAAPMSGGPRPVDGIPLQKTPGLALAFHDRDAMRLPGAADLPPRLAPVCSAPALIAMKGFLLSERLKAKDGHDIYYCIRNHPGGPASLAEACRGLLRLEAAVAGYRHVAAAFGSAGGFGPICVRRYMEDEDLIRDEDTDIWQHDAFRSVNAWVRALFHDSPETT